MTLSIVIPVYNEQSIIEENLKYLISICKNNIEIIICDGGSEDNTRLIAEQFPVKLVTSEKGRARQMNAGADHATGDTLLFLHMDTILPSDFYHSIQKSDLHEFFWGRFNVRFQEQNPMFGIIAFMMNVRSRLSGIATGDQAIFMSRKVFNRISGFPEIELMEDIAISKRLGKISHPVCLKNKVIISSRRWQNNGILKTILFMWYLRLAYFFGVKPSRLARQYA